MFSYMYTYRYGIPGAPVAFSAMRYELNDLSVLMRRSRLWNCLKTFFVLTACRVCFSRRTEALLIPAKIAIREL